MSPISRGRTDKPRPYLSTLGSVQRASLSTSGIAWSIVIPSFTVRVRRGLQPVSVAVTYSTVVPLTFSEAYLGSEVEIGTIHGPVRAKIPSGTQSGQRFRLRGKGVRNVRTGVHGDHYYTVQVTVPRVVSPAGREAARRVNELYVGAGDPRAGLPRSLA